MKPKRWLLWFCAILCIEICFTELFGKSSKETEEKRLKCITCPSKLSLFFTKLNRTELVRKWELLFVPLLIVVTMNIHLADRMWI